MVGCNKHTTFGNTHTSARNSRSSVTSNVPASRQICPAGENCIHRDKPSHRGYVHPPNGQMVIKNPNPGRGEASYFFAAPSAEKCIRGPNCQRFDIIKSTDKETGKTIDLKIFKCACPLNSHIRCRDGINCSDPENPKVCEHYHPWEEILAIRAAKIEKQIRLKREYELNRIANEMARQNEELLHKFQLEQGGKVIEDKKASEIQERSVPKKVVKPVPKKQEIFRIPFEKETLDYLVVELVRDTCGLRAHVIGIISGVGSKKTTEIEVDPNSFKAKSEYSGKVLYIETVSVSGVKGNKDGKMKYLQKTALGRKFVAIFGSSEKKCQLLENIKIDTSSKSEEDDCFQFEESSEEPLKLKDFDKSASDVVFTTDIPEIVSEDVSEDVEIDDL